MTVDLLLEKGSFAPFEDLEVLMRKSIVIATPYLYLTTTCHESCLYPLFPMLVDYLHEPTSSSPRIVLIRVHPILEWEASNRVIETLWAQILQVIILV